MLFDFSLLAGYHELQEHKLTKETISTIWPPEKIQTNIPWKFSALS